MDHYTKKIQMLEKCSDTISTMLDQHRLDPVEYANITQTLINAEQEIRRLKVVRKHCVRGHVAWHDGDPQ